MMPSCDQKEKSRRDAAYETHRREQMQHMAQLTFAEKLAWLEAAHHFVLQLQALNPQMKAKYEQSRDAKFDRNAA